MSDWLNRLNELNELNRLNELNEYGRLFVRHVLNNIGFCAFLIGLVPILLARTWRARWVAILFGSVCITLGIGFALSHSNDTDSLQVIRRTGLLIACALTVAVVSLFVTFRLDRSIKQKPNTG